MIIYPLSHNCRILYSRIKEGGEYVFGSTDLALKSARIVHFCGKSSGVADFQNTVDRG